MLYDSKNKKGLVYQKVMYKKYHKKGLVKTMSNLVLESDDAEDSLSPEEETTAFLYFRTCIVNKEKDLLKIKLKQTIKAREAAIKKKGTVFFQSFPFYFVDPELVCLFYFFQNRFEELTELFSTWKITDHI